MVGKKVIHRYTEDYGIYDHLSHKVCDRCATINRNEEESCHVCGGTEFTPMSREESLLLNIHPSARDDLI